MLIKAEINISTPAGRKIARELDKHKKQVKIYEQKPEGKTYSIDEVYEKGIIKLSNHYGVDVNKSFFLKNY